METQNQPIVSDEARQILQLSRQAEALKMNPAWVKMLGDLKEWRDEALEVIRNSGSADTQTRSNLLYQYEQRQSCIEFIEARFKSIAEARVETIRLIAELNGHHGEAAEDLVAALEGRPR
jgi:hypothetical protein